jgi:hypothetical protein
MIQKFSCHRMRTGFLPGRLNVIGFLVLLPSVLWATTVMKMDLDQLVAHSGRIVVGRCLSVESRWNAKRTLILTYSQFEVERDLKGNSPAVVTVVTIGGKVGDRVQAVAGMPVFSAGHEALLFLENPRQQYWLPVGLEQGYFRIVQNPSTGVREATRSMRGLEIVSPVGAEAAGVSGSGRIPLDRLVEQIKAALARHRLE